MNMTTFSHFHKLYHTTTNVYALYLSKGDKGLATNWTNKALLKSWQRWQLECSEEYQTAIQAFLYTCVKNAFIDDDRKAKREQKNKDEYSKMNDDPPVLDLDEAYPEIFNEEALREKLLQMSPQNRESYKELTKKEKTLFNLLVMKYTRDEILEKMQITNNSYNVLMYKIRDKFGIRNDEDIG